MTPDDRRTSAALSPRTEVESLDVDGNISLYHPEMDKALVLNATASDIWCLCDGSHTLGDVVRLLATAYGVTSDQIHDEVESTVRLLREQRFLAENSAP